MLLNNMADLPQDKMRKEDRELVLRPIDGKTAISTIGLMDKRLFTGENVLHAICDKQTRLWYMKMDTGILPTQLRVRFTSFSKLLDFAKSYYRKRNVEIVEIRD
jgi:hypothetical protein